MFSIDDLVESAINEAADCRGDKIDAVSDVSEWEKFASKLDAAADQEGAVECEHKVERKDSSRMHKLAMATILDVIDDPKVIPVLEKMAGKMSEISKTAFESPEPGTIGGVARSESLDAQTFVKNKVGRGKTIFEKLKNSDNKEIK